MPTASNRKDYVAIAQDLPLAQHGKQFSSAFAPRDRSFSLRY